jgi:hypothetical protein
VRRLGVVLLVTVASPAAAEPYRWPLSDGDRAVTAHYDHGGVVDWQCGNNTYSGHKGTDIGVPKFTDVFAAASGWVKHRTDGYGDGYLGNTDGGGFGNAVAIFHGDGDETIYGHLAAGTGLPALGATVSCADLIGGSGTSGNSTGPHLHFETRVGVDENGSYYSGAADDPYAGECGGPVSFWTDQAGDRPTLQCAGGTVPLTDDAAYVADVTIPDGTEVVSGTPFVKTWRIRNSGTSTWGDGYGFVHTEGPDFGAAAVPLAAEPGAEIDVTMTMTATGEGTQRSTWRVARDGAPFGETFWVEVVVVATPSSDGDGDGFGPGQDCDDADPAVHPGAEEACDGIDADCDGAGDDGLVRACCDGMQVCAAGAWGACDVPCDDDDGAVGGGCSSSGGAPGGIVMLGVLMWCINRRRVATPGQALVRGAPDRRGGARGRSRADAGVAG